MALFFNLKLARINEKRIGHLSFDAEQILRIKKTNEIILVCYFDEEICNSYLHSLIKKNFIYSKYFKILHHPKLKKIFTNYDKYVLLQWKNGQSRNLMPGMPQLQPTSTENEHGINFIKSIGLNPDKLVAIVVRDSAYLPELVHQNYRDCKLENYYPLINFLLNQGYSVIRMGKSMNSEATILHPSFYDYAFSKRKSDFLDVWIMMNACEVITTGTGLENITDISNRPYIALNFAALLDFNSWNPLVWWTPKTLCYKNSKTPVPLSEQIKSGSITFQHAHEYDEAGYNFQESAPELNVLVVEEVLKRRAKNYNDLFKNERSYIHQQFLNSGYFEILHQNKSNFNVPSEFIKKNKSWLLK